MKPSEELMLLLELNNYEVTRFKLKKQLEYEETGNIDLFHHNKFADLVISHYLYEDSLDKRHKNPLMYHQNWDTSINSISQFYVIHPEIDKEVTLGDFLLQESLDGVSNEKVLRDVFDVWVEEHEELSLRKMENLRDMAILLPEKSEIYKKPSTFGFFVSILLVIFLLIFYVRPLLLQPASLDFITKFIQDWNQLIHDIPMYYMSGIIIVAMLISYTVSNYLFSRINKNVKSIKEKKAIKMFGKWKKSIEKLREKQSKIIENYIDKVVEDPTKSFLDLKKLNRPELQLEKYKTSIMAMEYRYDSMIKNYRKQIIILKTLFILSIITFSAYIALGYALIRGWINVS
jgi:hypothetical protein